MDEVIPLDDLRRAALRAGLAEAMKAQTDEELIEQSWLRKTADFAEGCAR
jgi:hypothetical protein